MSVIKLLRKLGDSEKAKTGILIRLGLMLVLPCVWLDISKPESLFDLHYISGHGHTEVPLTALITGLIILFFGIRRLFAK